MTSLTNIQRSEAVPRRGSQTTARSLGASRARPPSMPPTPPPRPAAGRARHPFMGGCGGSEAGDLMQSGSIPPGVPPAAHPSLGLRCPVAKARGSSAPCTGDAALNDTVQAGHPSPARGAAALGWRRRFRRSARRPPASTVRRLPTFRTCSGLERGGESRRAGATFTGAAGNGFGASAPATTSLGDMWKVKGAGRAYFSRS